MVGKIYVEPVIGGTRLVPVLRQRESSHRVYHLGSSREGIDE